MKRLRLKPEGDDDWYDHDIKRIISIFHQRGYEITPEQAKESWERFSDSMCAGWMILDEEDADVFYTCMIYLEEIPED